MLDQGFILGSSVDSSTQYVGLKKKKIQKVVPLEFGGHLKPQIQCGVSHVFVTSAACFVFVSEHVVSLLCSVLL